MKQDLFEEWNERMVSKYDIETYYSASNPIIKYIERRRIDCLVKLLSPRENEKIFEVGCGAGHVLQNIHLGQLYAIDLSSRMLSLAKKRLGDKVELKQCNAESLVYADNFFDRTVCTEVLEHTLNPQKVICEIARVSKPGGVVILSIPNEDLINKCKDILVKMIIFKVFFKNIPEKNEWHLHNFSLPILRSMTKDVLKEIEIKAIPNRFFPLRYVGKYKVVK